MKKLLLILLVGLFVVPAANAAIVTYGWEDGGTILTSYGDIIATNVGAPDPVHGGERSLYLLDQAASGTPEVFVAWVVGLTDGDEVTANIWRYDTTPSASPSCRIWGGYTSVGGTIDDYAGSAGGNSDYGPGTGWDQTSYTWTFDSDEGARDGLTIKVRTYSNLGDFVWVDDLEVIYPDGTTAHIPQGASPVEESTWGGIKALYR